jgi:hypothetical protein
VTHYHVIENPEETLDTAPAFAGEQDARDYATDLANHWAVREPFVVQCDRTDCSYVPAVPKAAEPGP